MSPRSPFSQNKKDRVYPDLTNHFTLVEQNTAEWFKLRLGKITSSQLGKIMANYGKPFGKPAIEYAQAIALEHVMGVKDEVSGFKNDNMDRGHEFEPAAIKAYEKAMGVTVDEGGFYHERTDELVALGDSNDGDCLFDGCIEVKTRIPKVMWARMKKGGVDPTYKWQVHGHLWVGQKKWCDFVDFCPEFPENKQLLIYRVDRDEAIIEQMVGRVNEFRKVVEDHIEILEG